MTHQAEAPDPAPLQLDAPGVVDLLLDDTVTGLWELARRCGRVVSERQLTEWSRLSSTQVTKALVQMERFNLVRRERATKRLPRGGWRTTCDRIMVVHDRALPEHRALATRMIQTWTERTRRHLEGPTAAPGAKHWEKRAFTLEHLDEQELAELRSIGSALDAFMARVGAKYDGRASASPELANYFIALHVVPIAERAPLPARIALVSKERLHSKLTEARSNATTELSPRERDVARLLAAGRTRIHIARELGIAEATVRTLASRCYRKLGVSGRRELAVRLLGLGGA